LQNLTAHRNSASNPIVAARWALSSGVALSTSPAAFRPCRLDPKTEWSSFVEISAKALQDRRLVLPRKRARSITTFPGSQLSLGALFGP